MHCDWGGYSGRIVKLRARQDTHRRVEQNNERIKTFRPAVQEISSFDVSLSKGEDLGELILWRPRPNDKRPRESGCASFQLSSLVPTVILVELLLLCMFSVFYSLVATFLADETSPQT